jgi:hypothetical protein
VARIRSVKPELFTSPSLNRVPVAARYLFVGLWTESDDAGRFLANAKRIAGVVFPDDEDVTGVEVERWLGLLAEQDAIRFYQHNGTRYGYIPNWEKHQAASMRRGGSRFPAPSDVQVAREDVQTASVRPTEQVLEQGAGSREQGTKSSRPASAEEVTKIIDGIGQSDEVPDRPSDRQRYFVGKLRDLGWEKLHLGVVQHLNRTLAKGNGQHVGTLAVMKALEFCWEEKTPAPDNVAAYLTTRARSYLEKFHEAAEVSA